MKEYANKQKLWIASPFPGMNEIVGSARRNKYGSAQQKKIHTDRVVWLAKNLQPIKKPADFLFSWVEKNKRRDPDNIMAGQKFIFDGLVTAGILQNDGWSYVKSISHLFEVGEMDGVMVEIVEV